MCSFSLPRNGRLGRQATCDLSLIALKTLTSLKKESRPFFLGDDSIWSLPSVSSLSDCSIWRSGAYFRLAMIAFGAFQFIVPKYYYRLGKMEVKESRLLI